MNLRELGEMMRTERERRGLTHEEVMEQTKISRRNIMAIEEARLSDLPHQVYTRGFIKNYARMLGMDSEEVDAVLQEAFPPLEEAMPEDEITPSQLKRNIRLHSSSRGKGTKIFVTILVFLLLAAGVAAAIWYLPKGMFRPSATTPPESAVPQDQDTLAEPPAQVEPDTGLDRPVSPQASDVVMDEDERGEELDALESETPSGPSESSAPGSLSAAERAEPVVRDRDGQEAPDQEAEGRDESAALEAQAETAAQAAPPGDELIIRAVEACWLQASHADGRRREFYLRPGERLELDVGQGLTIKLGNAGGVRMEYKGRTVDTGDESGVVMSFSFP